MIELDIFIKLCKFLNIKNNVLNNRNTNYPTPWLMKSGDSTPHLQWLSNNPYP